MHIHPSIRNPGSGIRNPRSGSAAFKALALGLAAIVLIVVVAVLVQESGKPASGLDALTGRWNRPNEPYILEIRGVSPDGKLDAGYFNPQPIRVSRAEAAQDGGRTKVFVELNDRGYPGCTYNLVHDVERDVLVGVYFQAAMGQRYDVYFERMRE
jgi:hypothetical protein